ncbi:unnamed protein product [Mytilus edulis]|uniref:Uncharacterized protein n=1 Tax=Mytilus edulis TaxID=6550 RepID=A0A8S3Q0I4_MYTED|nr:unnamed protein product [Mytilus edulis]
MADLPSANACTQSSVKKTRERKPNFSEAEINLLQDEVEKNFAVINDKFGSAVWGKISMMVTSLDVSHMSAKESGATEARLSEEDSEMACTGSQDLFQSAMECQSESSLQPPTPPSPQSPSVLSGFIGNRGVPIVVNPTRPVNNESHAVPTAATATKKRKATAGDVHELQVVYFRGEIEKQKKEMKKLDLQIELLERIRSKEYQPMSLSQCLEALGSTN